MVPMLLKEHLYKEVSINFIGELLELEGYNAILVVTNKCSEVQYNIPAKTVLTAVDVADTYIKEI